MNRRFEKGYSLMEILVVVAIIGFIAAVVTAAFSNYLKMYRLTSSTRKVEAEIRLARMKAVSTNMVYTFHLNAGSTPNLYQIGGTNDINNSTTLEPWEDVFGDGVIHHDNIYGTSQAIENAKLDHQGLSIYPNGAASSAVMDAGMTQDFVFDGQGMLKNPGGGFRQYIPFQSQGNSTCIFVENTGSVHMYRFDGAGWTEFR